MKYIPYITHTYRHTPIRAQPYTSTGDVRSKIPGIRTYVLAYISVTVGMGVGACLYACMCVCKQLATHVCPKHWSSASLRACGCIRTRTYSIITVNRVVGLHAGMYICRYAWLYVCKCVRVSRSWATYIQACVCVLTNVHAYIYIYIYMHHYLLVGFRFGGFGSVVPTVGMSTYSPQLHTEVLASVCARRRTKTNRTKKQRPWFTSVYPHFLAHDSLGMWQRLHVYMYVCKWACVCYVLETVLDASMNRICTLPRCTAAWLHVNLCV